MKKTIKVTATNIKYGKRHDAYCCPIARAIKKSLQVRDVSVNEGYIYIRDEPYKTPEAAANFVRAFDRASDRKFAPFSFTLDV